MKKILLIAIAAISLATASQAQDSTSVHKYNHQDKAHKTQMFDELNLSQDQKDKMKKLRQDNMAKMSEIKSNASLTDDQKQEQIKELRKEQRKNVDAILTDEQKAKMKQLHQERAKHHMGTSADSTNQK